MVVERCLMNPATRVVCIREYQRSLQQSVKLLIEDKIEAFGVGHRFHCTRDRTEVLDRHGIPQGIIVYNGMQNHTAETIKSLEGFDIAYCEEAQTISSRSLTMLRPTIRKAKSELWFAWNPRSTDDPVDVFFNRGATDRTDTIFVHANYDDNPWFPDELRADMEYDRRRDPERYAHVWMGKYQMHSEARVFRNWRVGEENEFSTDAKTRFHFGADWGFANDPTVLVRCHIKNRTVYVDREAYAIGCEIDRTPALFDQIEAGQARKWRIIADSARPETISYMTKHGYPRMIAAKKGKGASRTASSFCAATTSWCIQNAGARSTSSRHTVTKLTDRRKKFCPYCRTTKTTSSTRCAMRSRVCAAAHTTHRCGGLSDVRGNDWHWRQG